MKERLNQYIIFLKVRYSIYSSTNYKMKVELFHVVWSMCACILWSLTIKEFKKQTKKIAGDIYNNFPFAIIKY